MSNLDSSKMSESSVDSRKEETENILKDILVENPHLITLGAKRYFRRVWVSYGVLALAMVIGIWAFTNRADNNLKRDLNRNNTANCLSSIKILNRYNDFVRAAIKTQKQLHNLNTKRGLTARAKLNTNAINRYQNDLIIPPTVAICKIPLLK